MKIKLSDQMGARKVLLDHSNDRVPISVAYKIMKIIKASEDDGSFYQQKIKEIIEEFGEKSPDGKFLYSQSGNVIIQNGKYDEFNNKVKELENTEVEKCEVMFALEELSPIEISANELMMLECYIRQD